MLRSACWPVRPYCAVLLADGRAGWGGLIDRVNRTVYFAAQRHLFLGADDRAAAALPAPSGTMFLARMGVGMGEAAASPLSQALIGDTMEARKVPAAMGFLHLSQAAGGRVWR